MSKFQKSPGTFTIVQLREKTINVRDNLETVVARHGAYPLDPDTVLDLHAFFAALLMKTPTLEEIKQSRIHRAILLISGRGTRWPEKLIDMCDLLIIDWTKKFGRLDAIRPNLYGRGGRLEGSALHKGLDRRATIAQWMADPTVDANPLRALEHGSLNFTPGQWWIHPLFAFKDGIIDSPDSQGGITADDEGAYAITATNYDEPDETPPDKFIFACKANDPGRLKLTKAILPPKRPVRVLRSHTLHSTYAPVVGVRYDGLYNVTGYSIKAVDEETKIIVSLQRLINQKSMAYVLSQPSAEEVDDYVEYKRLKDMQQSNHGRIFHRMPMRREFEFNMLPRPATPETEGFDPLALDLVGPAQQETKSEAKPGDGTESITAVDEKALQTLGKRLMAWYDGTPLRKPTSGSALGNTSDTSETATESLQETTTNSHATDPEEDEWRNLSYDGIAAPVASHEKKNKILEVTVDDVTGHDDDEKPTDHECVVDKFSVLKLRQELDKEAWNLECFKDTNQGT